MRWEVRCVDLPEGFREVFELLERVREERKEGGEEQVQESRPQRMRRGA